MQPTKHRSTAAARTARVSGEGVVSRWGVVGRVGLHDLAARAQVDPSEEELRLGELLAHAPRVRHEAQPEEHGEE